MTDPREVLTRSSRPPDLRVRYGPLDDHVADVRLPRWDVEARPGAPGSGRPLVVVVHGGFWRQGFDRSHTGPQCAALADAGYVVAAMEYRRTGGAGGWPATFDDVAAAVDALPGLVVQAVSDHADGGMVDIGRIALVGHSAGGHLALWAACRHRLPSSSPWHRSHADPGLRGVVSLAGVCDLGEAFRLGLGDGAVMALIGGGPEQMAQRYGQVDPARLLPTGVPSVLLHGDADDRVPEEISRRYAERAREAGDDTSLLLLPGVDHLALIDPLSRAWPQVASTIGKVLAFP